jgi:RNA polymerase sigma-70 factor (ECF subfamily)
METTTAEMVGRQDISDAWQASALEEMITLMSERLPYFQRIAFRRLNNMADAEDAVQNAFLSAWKHFDKFKGEARMSTWLTAIVMNAARMVVRKRSHSLRLFLHEQDCDPGNLALSELLPDAGPDPEAQVRRLELRTRLLQLSACLSPKLQEVIRLRSVEGLSVRETAEVLGLTDSAVKCRTARARQELIRLHQCHPVRVASSKAARTLRRKRREGTAQGYLA